MSAAIVAAIEARNEAEVKELCRYFQVIGEKQENGDFTLTFGKLFKDDYVGNHFEGISATCKICKQRGYMSYASPLLLQGAHDSVVLTLHTSKLPAAE